MTPFQIHTFQTSLAFTPSTHWHFYRPLKILSPPEQMSFLWPVFFSDLHRFLTIWFWAHSLLEPDLWPYPSEPFRVACFRYRAQSSCLRTLVVPWRLPIWPCRFRCSLSSLLAGVQWSCFEFICNFVGSSFRFGRCLSWCHSFHVRSPFWFRVLFVWFHLAQLESSAFSALIPASFQWTFTSARVVFFLWEL